MGVFNTIELLNDFGVPMHLIWSPKLSGLLVEQLFRVRLQTIPVRVNRIFLYPFDNRVRRFEINGCIGEEQH
jgi:hypothetical protein